MKISIENGRVFFSGHEFKDLDLEIQIASDKLLSKVDNDYSFNELIEMTRAKGRELGIKVEFITTDLVKL